MVGGGGGNKVPPGGPPRPPVQPKAHSVAVVKPPPAKAPKDSGRASDSHDDEFTTGEQRVDGSLEGALTHTTSASGISSLVRLIEATRGQLAGESRLLHGQAHSVVERLVAAGFAPSQLTLARGELAELRQRMAALRKRLQHLQRRVKTTFASAGKTGDAQFAKRLGEQLQRLRKLEPGMARTLLALQTVEQAYHALGDGAAPVLRLHVGEHGAPASIGRALAQLAPSAVIARATLAMLRDGPSAKMPQAPKVDDVDDARLDGPRAFVRGLLGTDDEGSAT